jgi:hypothetical protein
MTGDGDRERNKGRTKHTKNIERIKEQTRRGNDRRRKIEKEENKE